MQTVSLIKTASYLPKTIIHNDFFLDGGETQINPMFRGVCQRRHVSDIETPVYMMVEAIHKLMDDLNLHPQKDIDMILTNVSLPSELFMGSGAIVAKKIGANPLFVFDFHHSGCVSFLTMLDLAKTWIGLNRAKSAPICNVQNAGGIIFSQQNTRKKEHACVPGDGCGVAYIAASEEHPIVSIVQHCHPENAEGMYSVTEDGRKFWTPGLGEAYLDFDPSAIIRTIRVGNKIVPAAIRAACKEINLDYSKIDLLITTQPSEIFLRNWREALQLAEEKHLHTFNELGNLFGAAIPINFTRALENNMLKSGDKVVLAGFSHAGDFSASAIIHWK